MRLVIYNYLSKNYTLKYSGSHEVFYIYDLENNVIYRNSLFDELKRIFSLDDADLDFDSDLFKTYSEWVEDNKNFAVLVD